MRSKKVLSVVMALTMCIGIVAGISPRAKATEDRYVNQSEALYDEFEGDSLDTSKWLIAHKQWGGNNGGVVKENVSVSNGTLKLEGHGLQYTGDVAGYKREDGKLTGAAIATKEYYASGSYEVKAKVAPDLGACTAFWTFEYEEAYPGEEGYDPKKAVSGGEYCTVNHEIDIEIPTATSTNKEPNFSSARFNSFVRENDYTSKKYDLPYAQNDGEYHIYRFDWHTGSDKETARVDYYIDNVLLYTIYDDIPTKEGRFWVGLWFPCSIDSDKDGVCESGWAGKADFDTTVLEVDYVKITPYHEAGDAQQKEDYAYDGWAENSFPELAKQENYEHVANYDFSQGDSGWTIEGSTKVENGQAILTSSQSVESISQVVDVFQSATYTLTVNVVTDGARVTIGACKKNGDKDQSYSTDKSGRIKITFNNETANTTMKVYVQVERYQGSDAVVQVDDISLIGTSYVKDTVIEFVPLYPDENPDEPKNLVKNSSFDNGEKYWNKSGSASIANNKACLASGNDTDSISQTIYVDKGQTYTLSADITSNGAEIEFGVKGYQGRYTKYSEKYTKDGKYTLTFTVASDVNNIEVFATVERYQSNSTECSITNIALVEGETPYSSNSFIVDGYSLDIKDGSFYLKVYADISADKNNYSVDFALNDVTIMSKKVSEAGSASIAGKAYKVFNLNIAAKDIFKSINIALKDENAKAIGQSKNISVYGYAVALKKRNSSYASFVDSLLNYGAYAQEYFYNDKPAATEVMKSYSISEYSSIANKITSKAGISTAGYIGTSLVLENRVILRHYFSKSVNGAVYKDGIYYVEKTFDPIGYDQTYGGYAYSVNDYIKNALESGASDSLKKLMCALYEYEIEAKKL